ncbi:MAG: MBL fold metallo-hydrolase, partial [Bacteroidales bacterium]
MKKVIVMIATMLSVFSVAAKENKSTNATVQLIRNATLVMEYNGMKILVDPMFCEKGAIGSIRGVESSPMVDIAIPFETILNELNLVLVTHNHPDHYDAVASSHLDKSVKLIHQPADQAFFKQEGFINAESLITSTVWNGITITRTNAQHGTGRMQKEMGNASGFVLQAADQPTIYLVGDGIWTEEIYQNIKRFEPDYIIVN